jgi:hypothetical protein
VNIAPNGPGNDGSRTRDISGTPRTPRAAGERRDAQASNGSASSLDLSARGERFVSLRTRLEGIDGSRADHVARLRGLVAAGSYTVSGDAIAGAMLDDPATSAALGMK